MRNSPRLTHSKKVGEAAPAQGGLKPEPVFLRGAGDLFLSNWISALGLCFLLSKMQSDNISQIFSLKLPQHERTLSD